VPPRAVQELASLNAWEPIDGGYLVHDYDQYLEKGSRDRVRKHREVKRGGNVTETPDGNVTETFLARDGYPIPKPVPVESPPSSGTPKAPSYLPQREDVRSEQVPTVTTVSPPTLGFRAVELLQGFGELMGRTHSATEAIKAQEFCTELTYLSPAEMLERMRSHLAWCDEHQAHRPNSLAGVWSSLRPENDRRRDLGGRPADPGPGALGGLLL
jgi:hypothetical protein